MVEPGHPGRRLARLADPAPLPQPIPDQHGPQCRLDYQGGSRRRGIRLGWLAAGDWLALVFFCLLATSSFLVLELYAALSPEAASVRMVQVREWIDKHTDQAIVIGALLVGAWLLVDSLYLIVASA